MSTPPFPGIADRPVERKEVAVPTASLPQDPDLEQLRKQARELQRAVRKGQPEALHRARQWQDLAQAESFPLTAAQLVLAREHGFASWDRIHRYIEVVTARAWKPGPPTEQDESVSDRFLRLACLTYSGDDAADRAGAAQLLAAHPDLPARDLCVAAACADVGALRRHLAGAGATAAVTGGPYGWSPILYQAYARHDPGIGLSETLHTVDLLLGAGADPNDGRFWHSLPTPFTALTGVLGQGDGGQPWHPHATPLARRLLEAGADPNDGQVLYNRMFGTNDDHLVLLFEFGLGHETNGPWHQLLEDSLDPPAEMLRSLLAWAVSHDQRKRVELLARHGVDVVSPFTEERTAQGYTPVEAALVSGRRAMADLLISLGAEPPRLGPADTFVSALLAGDIEAVSSASPALIADVIRAHPGLLTWAAAEGSPDSVELMISAGFDVNAAGRSDVVSNDPWHTALHVAAEKGDIKLIGLLLDRGADPDVLDHRFRATPLGWAQYFNQDDAAALLVPVTGARE
jgi:ankyrin repeat protein